MKSKFDPAKHHRRSIRLKDYDYTSEGAYFVTIVTQGRECLFGEIIAGEMQLNKYGEIVQKWWNEIHLHFSNVETTGCAIMPNHVHGIILTTDERRGEVISPPDNDPGRETLLQGGETLLQGGETLLQGRGTLPLRKPTLGQIVGYFKYQSTKEMNTIDHTGTITKFWQRNYYEHIIRNEKDLKQKTDYIRDNPSHWKDDEENPRNKKSPGLS